MAANSTISLTLALLILTGLHALVDLGASTVNPLWPTMEVQAGMARGGGVALFVVWSAATSFSQMAFGWWADRSPARFLIWAGPFFTLGALGLLGLAHSPWSLSALLVIAGLGVAAFHPEAAAIAGAYHPEHRSRVLAVFGLGGFLGQTCGPYLGGLVTQWRGLIALHWITLAGFLLLALCWAAWRCCPAPSPAALPRRRTSIRRMSVVPRAAALLAIGSLRIVPAMGITLALAYLLEARQFAPALIGAVQSAYMAGIGIGGILCAAAVTLPRERLVLWSFPVLGAFFVASLGQLEGWWLAAATAAAGLVHGVGMPVFLSYSQRLLPQDERLASSITLGASWGVAGACAAGLVASFQWLETLNLVFLPLAACSLLSGLACLALPFIPVDKPQQVDQPPA